MYNDQAPWMGRPAPHDHDAELDLLSEMLCAPATIAIVRGRLKLEDFHHPHHRRIYAAIQAVEPILVAAADRNSEVRARLLEVYERPDQIHLGPVSWWIRDNGGLEGVDDRELLGMCAEIALGRASIVATLDETIQRVRDKARLRECAHTLHRALAEIYGSNGPHDAQAFLEDLATNVAGHRYDGSLRAYARLGDDEDATPAAEDKGERGILSGVAAVDELIGGWRPREVTAVTGQSGTGKTAWLLEQAARVVEEVQEGDQLEPAALVFSLEMPKEDVRSRVLCRSARVDLEVYLQRRDELEVDALARLDIARNWLRRSNLIIDDRKDLTIEQIRGTCHQVIHDFRLRAKRLALIGIDYYQLTGDHPKLSPRDNRERHLNRNGLEIVHLAEELNVPIILLAQPNENDDAIAECKSLKKHVQNWLHLKAGKLVDPQDVGGPRRITATVRKARNAPRGTKREIYFTGRHQRFTDEAYA